MHGIEKQKKGLDEFSFDYKTISAKYIYADESYNRSVNRKQVEKIIANFNPNLVNPVKVSLRDGKFFVFDGNHTLRALTEISGNNGDTPIYCKVYYGMTKEDEARLFAEQNGYHLNVSVRHKIRSLAVAKDPDVLLFQETVRAANLICDFSGGIGQNRILCYDTAYKIFRQKGKRHLFKILDVISRAWNGRQDSLKKEIICGMDILLSKMGNQIDLDRLVSTLSKESPVSIISMGKGNGLCKGNARFAIEMGRIYNKRLSEAKKLNLGELA